MDGSHTRHAGAALATGAGSAGAGTLALWDEHLSLIAHEADELQRELARLREASEVVANEAQRRDGELQNTHTALAQLRDERASVERARVETESAFSEARARLEEARERTASLEHLLEERHGELAHAQAELAQAREDGDHSRQEAETARRQANDLLRASRARLSALVHEVRSLRSRLAELEAHERAVEVTEHHSHVRLIAESTGYSLVECSQPPPSAGELVEVDGHRFRVTRLGRSPLPGDERPCAFLLAEPGTHADDTEPIRQATAVGAP